jgi:solute carrier family 6 amino acid transporter-like protein 5/7/9/14
MEMVLGQFSGRGPIKVWKCVPALKGIGFAQIITNCFLTIFYNYLMALTLFYLFASFQNPLPWSVCNPLWAGNCSVNETQDILISNVSQPLTASKSLPDLYFQ